MYPGQQGGGGGGGGGNFTQGSSNVQYLLQSCVVYKKDFRPRIAKDVEEVASQYGSLKVETDVYYANNGDVLTLIVLNGTIPIFYSGAQYNIPMSFWITRDYPMSPPLAYVTPTSTMQIARNHEYTSPDGSVFLPYLNQWNVSRSSLSGLVATCKSVFSQSPPVHAKSATPTPGYPSSTGPPSYNSFSQQKSQSNSPYPNAASSTPYPVESNRSPYPTYNQPAQPPPPYSNVAVAAAQEPRQSEAERKEAEMKSIREALRVRLQEKYKKFRLEMKSNLQEDMKTQEKLEKGQAIVADGETKLKDQIAEFQKSGDTIRNKMAQLVSWLEQYETQDASSIELNIDDAISPADGPSRQMFDCVAESAAIDDILYHLDRALSNDIIDLITFLKEVRKLSRNQFMKRALAFKIQKHQQRLEIQNRQPPSLNSQPPAYQSRYS